MYFKHIISLLVLLLAISSGFTQDAKPPRMQLHVAVIQNNLEAVQQHIKAGSDLDIKDPDAGSSPLITASLFGRTEIVQALLDAGAEVDLQNNYGSTALMTAAFFCHEEIVKILLVKGADKNKTNSAGATPLASVMAPFEQVKPIYQQMEAALSPIGLTLDYERIEKMRPEIAKLLMQD